MAALTSLLEIREMRLARTGFQAESESQGGDPGERGARPGIQWGKGAAGVGGEVGRECEVCRGY